MSNDLGMDRSGNGNNWTVNNLTYADQMVDSPTNNFATWNPLTGKVGSLPTFSEGNLAVATQGVMATMSMPTGRWYWEVLATSSDADYAIGVTDIADANSSVMNGSVNPAQGFIYQANGNFRKDGSVVDVVPTFTNGDIIAFNYDALWNGYANHLSVYKNNTYVGAYTLTNARNEYIPCAITLGGSFTANFGQDSSFAGAKTSQGKQDANGIGDFYYTPPQGIDSGTSDHFALCTSNLPDVAVVPSEHFNAIAYTGTGSNQVITGVGFQSDFLWFKNRSLGYGHVLLDTVRGLSKPLSSNSTDAEYTFAYVSSVSNGSITTASQQYPTNNPNSAIVVWNWKANGSGSSNTDGDLNSTVSVNTDAGFSIVSWVSNTNSTTTTSTIGHGLSQKAEMVITKKRSSGARNWHVGHKDLPFTSGANSHNGVLSLNSTVANEASNTGLADIPNATTFIARGDNGDNYIAYCFHSVDGYSKVGSYVGNGNADGTFVYTGFRPAFVLTKVTNAADDWSIADYARSPHNVAGESLRPNSVSAEDSSADIDILSNGFKLRQADSHRINYDGDTFIYIAFAETPFKYSNAR
tara:strand:- start:1092 stop:2831 length:1740 start_codon:yes stop_codon:yes gene_type:complete